MQNYIKCNLKRLYISFMHCPKFWYKPNWFTYLLLPFSGVYYGIVDVRHFLYRSGLKPTKHFKVPIIVVGNLTVGGTGKTPLVIWLAAFLKKQGFRPGIISRGYKAKIHTFPHKVSRNDTARAVGDEALLIAQKTNCPIVIAPDRVLAVKKLLSTTKCNIVISDDGLQHLALDRDLEILVIDGKRRFGNGYCLPAGPLREPKIWVKDADFIVTNGHTRKKKEFSMQFKVKDIYNLKNPALHKAPKALRGKIIHALAGVGNPGNFFSMLRELGLKVIEHPFPDHHQFSATDLYFANDYPIIMTEKDAVKCKGFANKKIWVLAIDAKLSQKFANALRKKLDFAKTR